MTPKQSLENARATITADSPEPKKRTRTDGAIAGSLFTRLSTIDAEEAAELEASPETIKAKHSARRAHALAGVSEEVRGLVERMRGQS